MCAVSTPHDFDRDRVSCRITAATGLGEMIRYARLVALITIAAITLGACGSGEPDAPLERVMDDARVFSVDDLRAVGMKASKQYDVSDLPGGVDAWYGFIRDATGPKDVEVRFYATHADAVALGTALADEASGDDALVDEETATWVVGVKDRIRLVSGGTADLAAWSGSRTPNYADFVIFGNMILLCQGDNPDESVDLCHELITALGSGVTP